MRYYFKCPGCGSDEKFTRPSEQSTGLGCVFLFFGGFIPVLLYADAQSRRVQCETCGYIFRQPALPKTGVAMLATGIFLTYIIAIAFAAVLMSVPEVADSFPNPQFIKDFVLLMSGHAEALTLLAGIAVVATLLLSVFASAISSVAQRRRLSKEFELCPKQKTITDCTQPPATNSGKDGVQSSSR